MTIRIGTRKSPLALAQAHMVRDHLTRAHPGLAVEILPITTSGDKFLTGPLSEIGGKGLFTKEIEEALLENRVDIAVHSVKDMQTRLPQGLVLACVLEREEAHDVLISRDQCTSLLKLPQGCTVGTSSLRRGAQVRHLRPDIVIAPLRGNVQTRLAKVEQGEIHATLLALAGLKRLGVTPLPGPKLSFEEMLPACAQGAIGIECRASDSKTQPLLVPLNHVLTQQAITAERALLAALDGSCRTPIAAYATVHDGTLMLRAMVLSDDGATRHVTEVQGSADDAEKLGLEAGRHLRAERQHT